MGIVLERATVFSMKSEKASVEVAESSKSKLSTRMSRFLHLLDRTDVEAASFVGIKDRILPRTSSGKLLIKSPESIEPGFNPPANKVLKLPQIK